MDRQDLPANAGAALPADAGLLPVPPAHSATMLPRDVIALAVRWYVRSRLSYADIVEWFAQRGLIVDWSTVERWVQRFLPVFGEAAQTQRHPIGGNGRGDETYCRLNGKWASISGATDEEGHVVDVYFFHRRTAQATQTFFEQALNKTGVMPELVTTDKAKCCPLPCVLCSGGKESFSLAMTQWETS